MERDRETETETEYLTVRDYCSAEVDGHRHELRFERNDDAQIITESFAAAHELNAEYRAVLLAEIQRIQAEAAATERGSADARGGVHGSKEFGICTGGQCASSPEHKIDIKFPRHRSCLDEAAWKAPEGVTVDGDLTVEVRNAISKSFYPAIFTKISIAGRCVGVPGCAQYLSSVSWALETEPGPIPRYDGSASGRERLLPNHSSQASVAFAATRLLLASRMVAKCGSGRRHGGGAWH
jgi:hypothetical protein